jgi:aminopeptidase N
MLLLKQFLPSFLLLLWFTNTLAQAPVKKFTRADTLRGTYGPYRENNDLLYYHLDIKVEPERKYISGKNTITFKMLKNDTKIQLDLFANMNIEKIVLDSTKLNYTREFNAVFVEFPQPLLANKTYSINCYYFGSPVETGRFGGITFKKDSLGNDWINTACQNIGASVWWPNKDQQADEVDSMQLTVTIPSELTDVSNGRLIAKTELGDGYSRYDWKIHYPINNYCVALNIGKYEHFGDNYNNLSLDFYVQPYHLQQAKRQFTQVKPMLVCYEHYFGPYPFIKDGYKLIEVPYAGMEHQSAVAYGNGFTNGYLGVDWTNVGISNRFDYIIIHESGHEWFGNSITCKDVADAWLQEGWCTYAEAVYVECRFGYTAALNYVNGYKGKISNITPLVGPRGVNNWPHQDMYFKGALFLNTLRHVINSDDKWWQLMRDYTSYFSYKTITTAEVIQFFNQRTGKDLTPVFEQYLNYKNIPILELKFDNKTVAYRWSTNVENFNMPVKVLDNGEPVFLKPDKTWKTRTRKTADKETFKPATDLFYIQVKEVTE